MPIAMTERQRHELAVSGFTVLESFLGGDELASTVAAIDRLRDRDPRPGRGCCAVDETCRSLMDHERALELVVDAVGWNIQMRDCIFVVGEPGSPAARPDTLAVPWHFDQVGLFAGLSHDGVMPLVDLKVSWYLSDHTEEGHGCTLVVPGSHLWTPLERATWEREGKLAAAVPIRVPIGSIMLWRSSMLHAVAPHLSADSYRYHIHISYTPRWIRPTGYVAHDPQLLDASSPVRRQLLGANGDNSDALANTGAQGGGHATRPAVAVAGQHWFPSDWAKVPLKAWAESRADRSRPFAWGVSSAGTSWPNTLPPPGGSTQVTTVTGEPASVMFLKTVLHPDSPEYQMLDEGAGYRQSMNAEMQAQWLQRGSHHATADVAALAQREESSPAMTTAATTAEELAMLDGPRRQAFKTTRNSHMREEWRAQHGLRSAGDDDDIVATTTTRSPSSLLLAEEGSGSVAELTRQLEDLKAENARLREALSAKL